MYWTFYRSTLTLNAGVSTCISLLAYINGENILVWFPVCFASAGLLAVVLYKEIARPVEYYFFYNRSISKIKLFLFSWIVNLLLSSLFLIAIYYVA